MSKYSDYMNKRMQATSEGKKNYDSYMTKRKKIVEAPKKVAKAVVKKVSNDFNTFRVKVTKKVKSKMGMK